MITDGHLMEIKKKYEELGVRNEIYLFTTNSISIRYFNTMG